MGDLERFEAAAKGLLRRYDELEVRSAAIRATDGSWALGGLFASPPSPSVETKPPDVDDARFHVERIAAKDVIEFARSWKDGQGSVGNVSVTIPRGNQPPRPPEFRYYREMQRTVDSNGVPDWTAETLSIESGTRGIVEDYGRHIDDQLFAAAVPWEGLSDVHRRFLMNRDASDPHDGRFRIRIPSPARLTLVNHVTKDRASIEVEFLPNNVAEGFQLGCVAEHADKTTSRLRLDLDDVPLQGGRRRYAFEFDARPTLLRLGLFVDGVRVHGWRWESFAAFGSTARLAALGLTEDQKTFVDRLRKGGGGRGMETEVALAFHLAGFSPGWYGLKGNEPDLVVFPDYGHFALVVECTKGGTDIVSKLKKLGVRTQMLRGRLQDGLALPVLVCRQASDLRTQSVQDDAAKDAVALMTPDDLVTIVEEATNGATTFEILEMLRELVPRQGSMLAFHDWSRAGRRP